jgi:acyl-homoserine lactone acylase PvdQ
VVIDDGSLRPTVRASAAVRQPPHASNFLIVGANRSSTGHPLFVGGPQIGYFYPGLTLEMDLQAPGMQARGATAPGFPGTILIGRGEDFAWTLTSAGSDLIDEFVVELCGSSRTLYRYKGRCRRMERINAGTIQGEGPVVFHRTVHGPVEAYATVGGRRVAIASRRASEGRDILFQLPFRDATLGKVRDTTSFIRSFAQSPFTFNVGYADDRDIAMFSAGRLPLRHPRTDPRLPTRGDGRYEWRGYLSTAGHAQQVNPADGTLVNYTNRPSGIQQVISFSGHRPRG